MDRSSLGKVTSPTNYKWVIFVRHALFHYSKAHFFISHFNISRVRMHPTIEVILDSMIHNSFNSLNNY